MNEKNSLLVIKALADASRLRVLRSLLDAPRCVEELAALMGLSASTVSFHLGKLEAAGLVRKKREQYYTMFEPAQELLDRPLRSFLRASEAERDEAGPSADAYHRKVLDVFVPDGRLRQLPAQHRKRRIVLAAFAGEFERGRLYSEEDVNNAILRHFDDYCTLRRELVDSGMMRRAGGTYRRVLPDAETLSLPQPAIRTEETHASSAPPQAAHETTHGRNTTMEKQSRKDIIRAYKEAERTAGIYRVRNLRSGRVLIGSDLNLHGCLNKHRFTLEHGSHRSETLQRDWNALGPDAFAFEVVETVQRTDDPDFNAERALEALEERWIEKLRPFADNCYNRNERIRRNVF